MNARLVQSVITTCSDGYTCSGDYYGTSRYVCVCVNSVHIQTEFVGQPVLKVRAAVARAASDMRSQIAASVQSLDGLPSGGRSRDG